MDPTLLPVLGLVATFVAAGCLESPRPQSRGEAPPPVRWIVNIGLAAVNYGLVGLVVQEWLTPETLGGLRLVASWPEGVPGLVAAVLALDLLRYAIHRLFHASPALWRLHALHHSDVAVDVSTTFRHHPLEFAAVAGMIAVAHAMLAVPVAFAVAYALFAETLSVIGHAHLRWPPAFERAVGWVVLTPGFHALHHSVARHHHDRNFGGVLTLWDRLFGTYLPPHPVTVTGLRFGVDHAPTAPRMRPPARPRGRSRALGADARSRPAEQEPRGEPEPG